MNRLDRELGEYLGWKVLQIAGDNDFRPGADGRGEDMPVIGIGQCQGIDEFFVANHQAVTNGVVHQTPGAGELLAGEFHVVPEDIANPFVMNRFCPSRTHDARLSEPNEQVTQRSGIEDIRVVDCGDDPAPSVAHPEFLGFGGELIENFGPGVIVLVLERHQIIESDATILAHGSPWYFSFVQKLRHVRS